MKIREWTARNLPLLLVVLVIAALVVLIRSFHLPETERQVIVGCVLVGSKDDRGWNEEKSVNIPLKSTSSSNGEWETYTVDINAKGWTGTITGLRFDPFNARGEMDIDYIKLTQ